MASDLVFSARNQLDLRPLSPGCPWQQAIRQFGLLGERPVLNAYLERCLARPAYQAALAREGELEDR